MIGTELGDLRRTHHSTELSSLDEGTEVIVMGWVVTVRGHGNIAFCCFSLSCIPESKISENFPTMINSSINLNLLYNFSRFFSQTSIVLNPSSFAPFKTCNEQ